MHGIDPNAATSGIPEMGADPTQGSGSTAWQQALKMGMEVNARNRRN